MKLFNLLILLLFVSTAAEKNVLMIVVDDLRPMINAVNPTVNKRMVTPNLDMLVKSSLYLRNAHVQYAECCPSRASVLTGRRVDTTRVYDLVTYFRNTGCSNCVTVSNNINTFAIYLMNIILFSNIANIII